MRSLSRMKVEIVLLTGFDDEEFSDADNEFAVQAIEANLWEEL